MQIKPVDRSSRDVIGRWDFRIETGGDRTARGELWLFPRGEAFTGTATVQAADHLENQVRERVETDQPLTPFLARFLYSRRAARQHSGS